MSKKLKWLTSAVVVLALGIGSLALVCPASSAQTTGVRYDRAGADPSTKGKKPNRYRCPRPQCAEPCDPAAPKTGICTDGTGSWEDSFACCCCNESFRDRSFRPPK